MSLVLQIIQQSISADGTTMVFADTTGNYNALTNPGGYGTPNAARNTLALFLQVFNNRFDGSPTIVQSPLTIAAYDPTVVASWTATLVKEGWQEATVYGVALFDETLATLYAVNEFVYDVASSQLRQILTVTGTGPYTYTYNVVTPVALGTAGTTVLYSTVYNTYAIPSLNNCYNTANDKQLLSKKESDFKKWEEISAYISSIVFGFNSGSYANAETKVETLEGICNCLNEDCGCS